MKTYGGMEAYLHHALPRHSIEVTDQLHALDSLLQGYHPQYSFYRRWVGPRAGLDVEEKRKPFSQTLVHRCTD
jgi:hypothetical protein